MSGYDEFDRTLARWFDAEAQPAATAEVLERALHATGRRRPRPVVFAALGGHWVGGSVGPTAGGATLGRTSVRTPVALLLLLLVLALVAGAVLVGASRLQQAPGIRTLGHLAYARADGLYVADWDGGNAKRIVSLDQVPGPEECRRVGGPTWSPDGRHLAFRTDWSDVCAGLIVITDAEGSSVTAIPGAGWSIGWSPDSSRIVTWISFWESIAVYGIEGDRQAFIPLPALLRGSGDHDPSWTSDGAAALIDAVVVPLDGTPPYREPSLERFTSRSRVSPDGTMIADPKGVGIVVTARDGSFERVLSTGVPSPIASILWSPTGDRIAFNGDGSLPGIVDVTTSATTTLDGLPNDGSDFTTVERFSPAGDRLLVSSTGPPYRTSALWGVQADGSGARVLVSGVVGGDWQWLPPGSAESSASPGPTPNRAASDDLGIFAPVAGRIVHRAGPDIWGVDPAAPADPATRVLLTSEAGIPLGWSRDGTRLLVAMPDGPIGGRLHLFVLNADGSRTQVTERKNSDQAAISPDGSRVVFADAGALYSVDADGGPAELFLGVESGFDLEASPTFSPDGTQIAYVVGRGDSDHRVWVVDADGGNAHQILANETTLGPGHVHGLAWSPAGDRIALGLDGIHTFAPDGADFRRVIRDGGYPHWSPDGRQIAYGVGCAQGSDGCGLAIANADGSNASWIRLATSGPWHPVPQ